MIPVNKVRVYRISQIIHTHLGLGLVLIDWLIEYSTIQGSVSKIQGLKLDIVKSLLNEKMSKNYLDMLNRTRTRTLDSINQHIFHYLSYVMRAIKLQIGV